MPFILIKGKFRVVGYAPDGDSVKFHADKDTLWDKLDGPKVKLDARGNAQLRFEGIDTPETHYQGRHQPLGPADAATDFTLSAMGITNVVWGPTRGRVTSAQDDVPGHILTRATERNRRPVSFVFAGASGKADGSEVHLDAAVLRKSINYKLVAAGHAFPTYYEGLFADLRNTLTAAVVAARKAKKGLWPQDRTGGVTVTGLAAITDQHTIMPKLFRRLADHLKAGQPVATFKQKLAQHPERLLILSASHFTHFDDIIAVNGKRVRLTRPPEDLVFQP
jgi:endonuclease YncB( thermonuclease family)